MRGVRGAPARAPAGCSPAHARVDERVCAQQQRGWVGSGGAAHRRCRARAQYAAMRGTPIKSGTDQAVLRRSRSAVVRARGYNAGTHTRSQLRVSTHRETSAKVDNRIFNLMRAAWGSCNVHCAHASSAGAGPSESVEHVGMPCLRHEATSPAMVEWWPDLSEMPTVAAKCSSRRSPDPLRIAALGSNPG